MIIFDPRTGRTSFSALLGRITDGPRLGKIRLGLSITGTIHRPQVSPVDSSGRQGPACHRP
jgi:hypothetical protein